MMRLPSRTSLGISLLLLAAVLLSGCGGGSDNTPITQPAPPAAPPASPPPPPPAPPAAIARIEIVPGAILLSQVGQTKQLVARAYAADGAEVPATGVTWTSSREAAIAVDAQGVARAVTANGSAQLRAAVGSITSEPILAIATTLPAGTVTVSDAQVFGEPVATNPDAEPSLNNTYRVVLQDTAPPAVGALVVASESKPVAGRVVAVTTEGGRHTVTLKLEPVRTMFPKLQLRESFDLTDAPIVVKPEIASAYEVMRVGKEWQFTPKSSEPIRPTARDSVVRRQSGPAPVKGTFALGPLKCEATVVGATFPLAILLNAAPAISFTPTFGLDIVHTEANGLEQFVVRGELVGKVDASLTMSQAIDGKFSCAAEVGAIPAPITGPLAVFITPMIPIEAGFEVGGRLTLASATVGAKAEVKGGGQIGIKCPPGSCEFVNTFTGSATAAPNLKAPSLNDQRFEPSLQLYLKAKGAIGNKFLNALRISAFEASIGPKLSGTFASERAQIGDASYKSEYKLGVETKVGAGPKLGEFLQFFGLSETFSIAEAVSTIDVGRSPTASVSADRDVFAAGETFNLKVAFDRPTLEFIPVVGPYNVARVVVVRKAPDTPPEEIKSVEVAKDTSELTIPITAASAGEASEFSVFVMTVVPSFPLELGAPVATRRIVFVASFQSGDFSSSSVLVTLRPDGSSVRSITNLRSGPKQDRRPTWSHDRTQVAFYRDGVGLMTVSSSGDNEKVLVPFSSSLSRGSSCVKWSPTEPKLAIIGRGTGGALLLELVDPSDGKRTVLLDGGLDISISCPSWSPDGKKLLFMMATGSGPAWYTLDLATRDLVRVFSGSTFGQSTVAWSPDGEKIASVRNDRITVYYLSTGREIVLTESDAERRDPAWSPDSKQLVFIREVTGTRAPTTVLETLTLATGEIRTLHQSAQYWATQPAW